MVQSIYRPFFGVILAAAGLFMTVPAQGLDFAPLDYGAPPPPDTYTADREIPLSSISGVAGHQVHLSKLGVDGDTMDTPDPNQVSLIGGGLGISWAAENPAQIAMGKAGTPTFILPSTPATKPLGGDISVQPVDFLAAEGQSLLVRWDQYYDWDDYHIKDTDSEGNVYNYSGFLSSIRAYVRYELIAIPKPSTAALLLSPLLLGVIRRPGR